MRNFSTFILLFFIFHSSNPKAQFIKTDTLTVFTYGQEQGLSQLNALSLGIDNLGYLWIGTENGLNRFNAYTMKTYMASEGPGALIDDHIRGLYFANDTLWLATDSHSLVAYLPKENKFINFLDQLDFSLHPYTRYTNLLCPVNSRFLLLGTNGNCLLFDRGSKTFTILPLPKAAKNDYITSACPLSPELFIIGTNNHGPMILDISTKRIHTDHAFVQLEHSTINSVYLFSSRYLISTERNLYWFDPKSYKLLPAFQNENLPEITSIQDWAVALAGNDSEQVAKKTAFLAATNHGYILNQDGQLTKVVFQDLQKNTLSAEVSKVRKDTQGGIWMGTNGRGVFYYHPKFKKFTPLRIKAANAPRTDFISIFNFLRVDDLLWMATEFGFASYDLKSKKYTYYPSGCLEYTLARDARGQIWGGGFGQGLVKYNTNKDRFDQITVPIGDKDVIQITPIDLDHIWIHTWSNGIFELDLNNYKVIKLAIAKNTLIRSRTSYQDRMHNIWIGSDEGIYRIHGSSVKKFGGLSNKRVFGITQDPAGNIWVGTAKGLNRIDSKTDSISSYTKSSGLPNDFIYGVLSDQQGNIWCSTNYGLSQFDPVTKHFRNYTQTDGLQNNEFNGKAAYQDQEGNLYFGGMDGFNIFNPASIFTNTKVGNTVIEDVQVFGKSLGKNLPYIKSLVLAHDQNVISFEYTALNYLWSAKNLYQFMLEGFDRDWRSETEFRTTTYTNLDPGSYVFKVRSTNNDGVWGPATSLYVLIKGPWYRSLWFKILAGALLLLILIAVFQYRNYQQKQVNKKLLRMVTDRTQALQKINQELNQSLELSEKQKENITFLMRELNHRVKNNLQIITSLIDIQDLSSSSPSAKSKLKLLQSRIFTVSRIHDILTNTEEKEEIRIDHFLAQLAAEIIAFSGKKIRLRPLLSQVKYSVEKLTYLGLILNELITNSLKHAFKEVSEPEITLQLIEHETGVLFVYKDNGPGFKASCLPPDDKPDNETIGVNLIKFLVKELKGVLDLSRSEQAEISLLFSNQNKTNGL